MASFCESSSFLQIAVVFVSLAQIQVQATSFVPSLGQQWPWSQWTTTEAPGKRPTKPTTTLPTTTEAPPPEITFIPPLESDKNLLIITDPNTGKMIYIPADVFWERFGGSGWNPSNRPKPTTTTTTPRNPLICDFYARNCWSSQETSTRRPTGGGGGGSHIYGFPGFHQGAFPSSSRPGNGLSSLPPATTRRPENMAVDTDSESEGSASTWPEYQPAIDPRIQVPARYPVGNPYRVPSYFNNRQNSNSQLNRVYQPDLSSEDPEIYDERHNHRHFFPNTFKRGYVGSGVGGTVPCTDCKDNESKLDSRPNVPSSTLPTLIRVTRPSVYIPNPTLETIAENGNTE